MRHFYRFCDLLSVPPPLTGTVGVLGACVGFHAIYNLLVTAQGAWRTAGYLFPSLLIAVLFLTKRLLLQRKISL